MEIAGFEGNWQFGMQLHQRTELEISRAKDAKDSMRWANVFTTNEGNRSRYYDRGDFSAKYMQQLEVSWSFLCVCKSENKFIQQ